MVGSKFFIFGGQRDDGGFMNDLVWFDLQKREFAECLASYIARMNTLLTSAYTSQSWVSTMEFCRLRSKRRGTSPTNRPHYRHPRRLDLRVGISSWQGSHIIDLEFHMSQLRRHRRSISLQRHLVL